jgi:uncharacterized protein YecE (DUF72 family)
LGCKLKNLLISGHTVYVYFDNDQKERSAKRCFALDESSCRRQIGQEDHAMNVKERRFAFVTWSGDQTAALIRST